MRMFSEEKKNGTIELLFTKPLSEYQIIFAKLLAGITLVFISILPTIVYYISVYMLGDPIGNVDTGSVIGSYIGLLFLGSAFVAIGLFASVLTNNQIVAFIVAILLSVFCYLGFETVYNMDIFGSLNLFVRSLGIRYHYESISRGVIDTRDVLYFLSVIALFVMLTRVVLLSRKWQK